MRLSATGPNGGRERKSTRGALLRCDVHADPSVSRTIEWAKLAEDQGFDAVWAWDSHVLWQEFYATFALVAANTDRVRLGPCVTNPATRDMTVTASAMATLQEISGGGWTSGWVEGTARGA